MGLFGRGKKKLRFDTATLSNCGLVRKINQDRFFVSVEKGVFAVADGMGGGEGGEKASAMMIEMLGKAVSEAANFIERMEFVLKSIETANQRILKYSQVHHYRQMGTTLVALLLNSEGYGEDAAMIAFIGDSRIYRLRNGVLEQLSRDHTVAGEIMGRYSGNSQSARDYDRGLAFSHVLTRAVGVVEDVEAEWRRIHVIEGDRFLLCSDGVHDMLGYEGIKRLLEGGENAEAIAQAITRDTLKAGALDNFTAVVVLTEKAV